MLNLLIKYKIATIIPVEDSFFHTAVLPQNIKFSKEILTLNYEKLSPFSNPLILSYMQGKQLALWFTRKKQSDYIFIIPESFLLFKTLENESNAIHIFDCSPKKVLVIKDKKLLASFTIENSDEFTLDLLKNEYQVDKSFFYSQEKFNETKSFAIKQYKLQDLYYFIQLSLDRKNIQKFVVEKLTYPIISLFAVYIMVSYLQSYFMQQKVDMLTQEYKGIKNKNIIVKNAIKSYNKKSKQYELFAKNELFTSDPYNIFYNLYKVITKKDKAVIKSLNIVSDSMTLAIKTKEGSVKYLNRLNSLGIFKNVVIQNTSKDKKGEQTVIYYAQMKDRY